jgi:hypothetical protein
VVPVAAGSRANSRRFCAGQRCLVRRAGRIGRGNDPGKGGAGSLCSDSTGQRRTVQVIVETKGCWNDAIMNAMEKQLVRRYLGQNECRCGIYLIGWFDQKIWDDDSRHGKVKKEIRNFEAVREEFTNQARRLTTATRQIQSVVLDASLTSHSGIS